MITTPHRMEGIKTAPALTLWGRTHAGAGHQHHRVYKSPLGAEGEDTEYPWLTTMTFGLNKVDANYNWWQERYDGPIFLVYGRNMRMGESSSGGRFISR